MSEYDSLSRDELISQLEAREWMLNRYRRLTDDLERDVEFYEDSFELAKDEVHRLRDERDTDKQRVKTAEEMAEHTGTDPERIRDGLDSVRLPENLGDEHEN
jgi:hypothetical protein